MSARLNLLEAAIHCGLVTPELPDGHPRKSATYRYDPTATIRSLVSRNQIPHIRISSRLCVFDRDELDAWLNAKRVDVGAPRVAIHNPKRAVVGGKARGR